MDLGSPNAFLAFAMTVLASCAAALPAMNATPIPMSASFLTTPLLLDRLDVSAYGQGRPIAYLESPSGISRKRWAVEFDDNLPTICAMNSRWHRWAFWAGWLVTCAPAFIILSSARWK